MIRIVSIITVVCFLVTGQVGAGYVYAQDFRLPAPGMMVSLSPEFNPPILTGIKVYPDNPFKFDFILDQGDFFHHSLPLEGRVREGGLKEESTRLIKYFLASLTIPEQDLWVNLSPYEKSRIIPESFGKTEMGRDLLAEDYLLKQITASLIYPEDKLGQKFWKRIYEEAAKKYGTTDIPVNTFNKVWIVPDKAVVFENPKAGTAYVEESKLKVMLEQDYLALEKNTDNSIPLEGRFTVLPLATRNGINSIGVNIVRELIIPELTKEVNEGKNFTQLRQVYNSLILADWFKKKIKDSIMAQAYGDKRKIAGLGYKNTDVKYIYQRYLQAFKKGAYNYIKEEIDPVTQQAIPRKYFSGGVSVGKYYMDHAMSITQDPSGVSGVLSRDMAMVQVNILPSNRLFSWDVDALPAYKKIVTNPSSQTPIFTSMPINKIDGFSLDKHYQIFQTNKDRPSLISEITKDKRYPFENTPWETVAKELGLDLNSIVGMARKAESQGKPFIILEFGVGKADALKQLSVLLRGQGIDNVRLVGISKDYYPQWQNISDDRITLIWDHGFNIDKYMKLLRGVGLVFSYWGMTHTLRFEEEYSEFFRDIEPLMDPDGKIIFNAETSDPLDAIKENVGQMGLGMSYVLDEGQKVVVTVSKKKIGSNANLSSTNKGKNDRAMNALSVNEQISLEPGGWPTLIIQGRRFEMTGQGKRNWVFKVGNKAYRIFKIKGMPPEGSLWNAFQIGFDHDLAPRPYSQGITKDGYYFIEVDYVYGESLDLYLKKIKTQKQFNETVNLVEHMFIHFIELGLKLKDPRPDNIVIGHLAGSDMTKAVAQDAELLEDVRDLYGPEYRRDLAEFYKNMAIEYWDGAFQKRLQRVWKNYLEDAATDLAGVEQENGGIDLTLSKMNVEIKKGLVSHLVYQENDGIKFKLDPEMVKQLQNAPGFVPVIINIKPLEDIKSFLEI